MSLSGNEFGVPDSRASNRKSPTAVEAESAARNNELQCRLAERRQTKTRSDFGGWSWSKMMQRLPARYRTVVDRACTQQCTMTHSLYVPMRGRHTVFSLADADRTMRASQWKHILLCAIPVSSGLNQSEPIFWYKNRGRFSAVLCLLCSLVVW